MRASMSAFTPTEAARLALACLDLTSLGEADTGAQVATLVARSRGPAGAPAALCVWPRFVSQVATGLRALHGDAAPNVAAVANFPGGQEAPEAVLMQVRGMLAHGAQEVDLVLDWRAVQRGSADDLAHAAAGVRAVRQACRGATLKLILESGELHEPALIQRASLIGLNEGVDFLKTSTGKMPHGATPEAARVMLTAIASHPRGARVGFKASGGVRTVADATVYLELVREILGPQALTPQRFRIGASSLLDDIEAVLGRGGGDAMPLADYGGAKTPARADQPDADAADGGDGAGDGGGGGGDWTGCPPRSSAPSATAGRSPQLTWMISRGA
jgi:deoxyribose-phosphate aldolase